MKHEFPILLFLTQASKKFRNKIVYDEDETPISSLTSCSTKTESPNKHSVANVGPKLCPTPDSCPIRSPSLYLAKHIAVLKPQSPLIEEILFT